MPISCPSVSLVVTKSDVRSHSDFKIEYSPVIVECLPFCNTTKAAYPPDTGEVEDKIHQ